VNLRPAGAADAPALLEHWGRPEVRRFLWDDEAPSADQVAAVLASTELWVLEGPGETFVGTCGLRPVEGRDTVELLYSLEPEHWGQGHATNAAKQVLTTAFERGADIVLAGVDDGNDASLAVLRRLGFEAEDETSDHLVLTRERFLIA
jgi:[ribosomal protein S5]-alanine N-acetyltransferase